MLRKNQVKQNKKSQKLSKTKMVGSAQKRTGRKNHMISLTLETPLGLSEKVGGMENLLKLLLEYILNRGSSQVLAIGGKFRGKKLSITRYNNKEILRCL